MSEAVMHMPNDHAILCYQQTMHIAKQWLGSGMITQGDWEKIDTIVAEKFGVSDRSIWREINLISLGTNGNIPPTKGGIPNGADDSEDSAHQAR